MIVASASMGGCSTVFYHHIFFSGFVIPVFLVQNFSSPFCAALAWGGAAFVLVAHMLLAFSLPAPLLGLTLYE